MALTRTISPTIWLYRVTFRGESRTNLLRGHGAYYRHGGRYNQVHQPAVYTTPDPLVAITEQAFYSARDWQDRIGTSASPTAPTGNITYPLQSTHLFWAFSLSPGPTIADLLDPAAPATFNFRPFLLHHPVRETDPATNPVYSATRLVADRVRSRRPRLEGLLAPSVRTPALPAFQPTQFVLFPFPKSKGLPSPLSSRATIHACLLLTLEFLNLGPIPAAPVSAAAGRIDWSRPRFRLDPVKIRRKVQAAPPGLTIPPDPARPAGVPLALGTWHSLTIKYD